MEIDGAADLNLNEAASKNRRRLAAQQTFALSGLIGRAMKVLLVVAELWTTGYNAATMPDPTMIYRPTVYGDPLPIGTIQRALGVTYLLWCPEQGGWQTGEWWPVSTAGENGLTRLDPIAYIAAPPDAAGA
jgi:hypothetical protein